MAAKTAVMSLFEQAGGPDGGEMRGVKPGGHKFEFDAATRRMFCIVCGGLMNECPILCGGKNG